MSSTIAYCIDIKRTKQGSEGSLQLEWMMNYIGMWLSHHSFIMDLHQVTKSTVNMSTPIVSTDTIYVSVLI